MDHTQNSAYPVPAVDQLLNRVSKNVRRVRSIVSRPLSSILYIRQKCRKDMRRARNPMPPALRDLYFNPKSGFYEIEEIGIKYRMNLEETRKLRDYFRSYRAAGWNDFPTVAGWYQDQGNRERKKVIRSGEVPELLPGADGFYPDYEWPD